MRGLFNQRAMLALPRGVVRAPTTRSRRTATPPFNSSVRPQNPTSGSHTCQTNNDAQRPYRFPQSRELPGPTNRRISQTPTRSSFQRKRLPIPNCWRGSSSPTRHRGSATSWRSEMPSSASSASRLSGNSRHLVRRAGQAVWASSRSTALVRRKLSLEKTTSTWTSGFLSSVPISRRREANAT